MKRLLSKVFSRSRSGALSFAAKSTLIGFGSLSATGAFAGSSPSFIRTKTLQKFITEATDEQLIMAQSLVSQKLASPELTADEHAEWQEILFQLKQTEWPDENVNTEN